MEQLNLIIDLVKVVLRLIKFSATLRFLLKIKMALSNAKL